MAWLWYATTDLEKLEDGKGLQRLVGILFGKNSIDLEQVKRGKRERAEVGGRRRR